MKRAVHHSVQGQSISPIHSSAIPFGCRLAHLEAHLANPWSHPGAQVTPTRGHKPMERSLEPFRPYGKVHYEGRDGVKGSELRVCRGGDQLRRR